MFNLPRPKGALTSIHTSHWKISLSLIESISTIHYRTQVIITVSLSRFLFISSIYTYWLTFQCNLVVWLLELVIFHWLALESTSKLLLEDWRTGGAEGWRREHVLYEMDEMSECDGYGVIVCWTSIRMMCEPSRMVESWRSCCSLKFRKISPQFP